MTPDAFRGSGLNKLTPTELGFLNRWLSAAVPIIAPQMVSPQQTGNVIESRIDGEFHGWDGDTVYKLQNGQIWQQSSFHYHYHYAYNPSVLVYNSGGGYKMKVEDDSDEPVSVRRLR